MADQHVGLQVNQLLSVGLNTLNISFAPAIIDPNIVAILPAELLKPLLKNANTRTHIGIAFRDSHQHAKPPNVLYLLRARHKRPCCCAAEHGYELPPSDADCHLTRPRWHHARSNMENISRLKSRVCDVLHSAPRQK